MFVLLGISILLAALLTLNSISSLCTAVLWRVGSRCTRFWSAAARARTLFLLRILPAAVGTSSVLFLVAPAYVKLEPRSTVEPVSAKLAFIAVAAAVGLGTAIVRGAAAWRATRRLTNDWLAHAHRVSVPGVSIPAYWLQHRFPVIAIVGILRPKLFVGHQIFACLTPSELSAAVEHEMGHLRSSDNLKRGLLRICRDVLLIIPCGRALDHAWAEASEAAADEHAAANGRTVALDLASALVKISRIIPPGARPAMPAGAFLIRDDAKQGGVKTRVCRLIQMTSHGDTSAVRDQTRGKIMAWISFGLFMTLVAISCNDAVVLSAVHTAIESAVAFLN